MVHAIAAVALVSSCKLFSPGSTGAKVVSCASEAVERNWHRALPSVNTCLTVDVDEGGWRGCLFGLINPAAGITESVIACVLRDQGEKMAQQAEVNAADVRSKRGAERAQTFIAEQRYKFE